VQLWKIKAVFEYALNYSKTIIMKKMIFPVAILMIMIIPAGIVAGQTTETRNVKDFTRVSFGVAGDLTIKFGPEYKVVIEGPKRVVEETIMEVRGDRLVIRRENWKLTFNEDKVVVNITMPEIEGLGVSGSGKAFIADAVKDADDLNLSVSGSGKILTSELVADKLDCGISGSGDIKLGSGGSVDEGEISISGSGSFSGESVEIDHLRVSVSGSGDCYCKVGDSLDASVSGSGNVNYVGNPKINARVSGSGHVRSR
jgi:hypothetical protein